MVNSPYQQGEPHMADQVQFQVIRQPGDVFVVSSNGGRTVAAVTMSARKAGAMARRLNRAGA